MSKRLASFHGPSTPNASPVQLKPNTPASPSRPSESTYHRKVRATLQEMRSVARTWDDLVRIDGIRAATNLIDNRTELENLLQSLPVGNQPRTHVVGPRLAMMENRMHDLDQVTAKLRKQFAKMNALVEGLEETLYEAHKTKGWGWVYSEPLWCTWPLERFATKLPTILPPYYRSLNMHVEQVNRLRSHALSFEMSREILTKWAAQPYLEGSSWDTEWDDLCAVEVERWNAK